MDVSKSKTSEVNRNAGKPAPRPTPGSGRPESNTVKQKPSNSPSTGSTPTYELDKKPAVKNDDPAFKALVEKYFSPTDTVEIGRPGGGSDRPDQLGQTVNAPSVGSRDRLEGTASKQFETGDTNMDGWVSSFERESLDKELSRTRPAGSNEYPESVKNALNALLGSR